MTKPMVLCINREALHDQSIPYHATGIYPFNLQDVQSDEYHFMNRKLVDSENRLYNDIAYHFPQILPYIAITDGQGKYLSYSRNGTETRLHGSRSIGIGGHVDITDINERFNIIELIQDATYRELAEEIMYYNEEYIGLNYNKLIVDTYNPVGKVHVGLFTTLVYPKAKSQEELHDPQWVTIDELKAAIDEYENWSKLIIKSL